MKQYIKVKLLSILLLAFITACERETPFELVPPSLLVLGGGPDEITQEPGNEVFLEFTMQAASGLNSFTVEQNRQLIDNINFTAGEISANYQFEYTIPVGTNNGTQFTFTFKVTDIEGREAVYNYLVKVNSTFSEENIEINGTQVIKLKGRLNNNYAMEAANNYLIDSTFSVENNSTLTIEKGTNVYFKTYAETNLQSKLVIARGSKIVADATKDEPIVFTSDKLLLGQEPLPNDWAGVFIYGNAPTNQGAQVLEEGFRYGGTIANDNSGTIRYLRIEYAGKNGNHALHLFGVGSATVIDFVQVFKNENIAFRVKGGRVNLKHIAAIGHGGYGIWAEHGWQANGQFWVFQTNRQATLVPVNFWNQARSIEMRNDESFFLNQPRTNFKISNVTLIGNGFQPGVNNGTRRGIRIRRGAAGILQNAIVTQFPDEGVRVEDLDISELGNTMQLANTRSYNNETNYEQEAESFFQQDPQYNVNENPVPGINLENFVGSEASTFNPTDLGTWFTSAPYIGAIENVANDWTADGTWFKDINGNIR